MGLESNVDFLVDLNRLWPLSTDQKRYGDDHVRNLKKALQQSFGGFSAGIWVTGTDGGAANAYTVNPAVLPPSLGAKMTVVFAPVATNTGACTLNYAGLGVKALKSVSGADLVAGDLVLGSIYAAFYNGTEYRLLSITKNYADQLAFSAALPAQPAGTVFRGLYTYNGAASWRVPPMVRIPRTSNTALDETVGGALIDITSGTFTQTIAAVATLPTSWFCYIQNSGTGYITLDPNGAETIDGLATRMIYPEEVILLYKEETATAFRCIVLNPFYLKITTLTPFVMPSGYTGNMVDVDLVGGAGGAGSGRKGAAGTLRTGGSPGGAPGRLRRRLAVAPNTSISVSPGANGTPGASQTVDNTDGNPGTAGGNTTFGTLATAYGGCAGAGGQGVQLFGLCSGSGSLSAGTSSYTGVSARNEGGFPRGAIATMSPTSLCEEGGADAFAQTGGPSYRSIWGGASSVSGDTSATTPTAGGNSQFGVAGGGFGGWVTTGNTPTAGCDAGKTGAWTGAGASGGIGGAAPAAGANGTFTGTDLDMGNPGAGGGATATAGVNGGRGGDGAGPGAPAGGGGACTNGAGNSGAGGTSQPGQAIIKGVL